jgi:ankyrin repeat protein
LLHFACQSGNAENVKLVLDEFANSFGSSHARFLSFKTKHNKTALMFAARNAKTKVFETLWNFIESKLDLNEQRKMLLEEDEDGWTAFHFSTRNKNKKIFELVTKVYVEKL